MPHQIDRRQKPAWKQVRRPLPPPTKPHSTKKGKKGYDRKDQRWKKEIAAWKEQILRGPAKALIST